jgi:hypothetical protein
MRYKNIKKYIGPTINVYIGLYLYSARLEKEAKSFVLIGEFWR